MPTRNRGGADNWPRALTRRRGITAASTHLPEEYETEDVVWPVGMPDEPPDPGGGLLARSPRLTNTLPIRKSRRYKEDKSKDRLMWLDPNRKPREVWYAHTQAPPHSRAGQISEKGRSTGSGRADSTAQSA